MVNRRKEIKKNKFASCVSVMSLEANELFRDINELIKMKCDFIEWRRDYFMKGQRLNPNDECDILFELKNKLGNQGLIYTYRSAVEGGAFSTENSIRKDSMILAIESNAVDYIDLELDSDENILCDIMHALKKSRTGLILSHHNFELTPSEKVIMDIYSRMEKTGADVFKLAVFPHSEEDLREFLGASLKFNQITRKPMIAIGMGNCGAMTRIVPELCGGSLTYVLGKEKIAPGQLTLEEIHILREKMGRR
jgi:3-dehydroquinate dehydratase-1